MSSSNDNTLDKQIEDLAKAVETLSSNLLDNAALSSSDKDLREKAERVAKERLDKEEKLLKEQKQRWEDEKEKRELDRAENKAMMEVETERRKHWSTTLINTAGAIKNVIVPLVAAVKHVSNTIMETWAPVDKAASNMAKSIGISKVNMDAIKSASIDFANNSNIGAKYNTSIAEIMQMQVKYANELGRSVRFTNNEMEEFAAMKQLVGEEAAVKFTASFEKFGVNMSDAAKEMVDMRNDAIKAGLSFEKYSSNLLENISLAQRYTFKNGLEGLQAMAKQSTAIKWNMQQTASFAEKVGTVEGAVTTSAQMSVLGGQFGNFANPMTMLYESLNDMESLNDRLSKMFSQFASFNKQTNQIEVSAFDRMRIKSAAQAMGLDYGQVMDSVFAQGRRKVAEQQMRKTRTDVDEGEREFLLNSSMIDRKTGRAYVNLTNEKGVTRRKYLDEKFSDADKKDLSNARRTETEDIKAIATATMSINDLIEGVEKSVSDLVADWVDGEFIEGVKDFIKNNAGWIKYAIPVLGAIKMFGSTFAAILAGIWAIRTQMRINQALRGLGGGGTGGGVPVTSTMSRSAGAGARPALAPGYRWDSRGRLHRPNGQYARAGEGFLTNAAGATGRRGLMSFHAPTLGSSLAGLGISAAGGIAWAAGSNMRNNSNGDKSKENWGKALSIAGSAATGAGMGAVFGLPGAIIGGVLGLGMGLYDNYKYNKRKKEEEEEARKKKLALGKLRYRNINLSGDYTSAELEQMLRGRMYISDVLKAKMEQQGDGEQIPLMYSKGGLLPGNTHAEGGIPAVMKNGSSESRSIELEKDELILSADAARKYIAAGVNPNRPETIMAGKNLMNTMNVIVPYSHEQLASRNNVNGKIELGGTLVVDAGDARRLFDMKKYLHSPQMDRYVASVARESAKVLGNTHNRHNLSRHYDPNPNGRTPLFV